MQTPTENIYMVRAELREEEPSVNIATRSGAITGEGKGKKPDTDLWIRKAPKNKEGLNLKREKGDLFRSAE